jgi:hypothetical protein
MWHINTRQCVMTMYAQGVSRSFDFSKRDLEGILKRCAIKRYYSQLQVIHAKR